MRYAVVEDISSILFQRQELMTDEWNKNKMTIMTIMMMMMLMMMMMMMIMMIVMITSDYVICCKLDKYLFCLFIYLFLPEITM